MKKVLCLVLVVVVFAAMAVGCGGAVEPVSQEIKADNDEAIPDERSEEEKRLDPLNLLNQGVFSWTEQDLKANADVTQTDSMFISATQYYEKAGRVLYEISDKKVDKVSYGVEVASANDLSAIWELIAEDIANQYGTKDYSFQIDGNDGSTKDDLTLQDIEQAYNLKDRNHLYSYVWSEENLAISLTYLWHKELGPIILVSMTTTDPFVTVETEGKPTNAANRIDPLDLLGQEAFSWTLKDLQDNPNLQSRGVDARGDVYTQIVRYYDKPAMIIYAAENSGVYTFQYEIEINEYSELIEMIDTIKIDLEELFGSEYKTYKINSQTNKLFDNFSQEDIKKVYESADNRYSFAYVWQRQDYSVTLMYFVTDAGSSRLKVSFQEGILEN